MKIRHLAALSALGVLPSAAQAETLATDTLLRGAVAGDFPGFYGARFSAVIRFH